MHASFRGRHPLFVGANAGGAFDQRCRELAPVFGEHLVFRGELLLGLGRLLLLRAQRIEFLFALLDGLGGGRLLCRLVRLGLRRFDVLFALLGEVGRRRLP
jgi:hypothetical protein